MAQIDEVIKAAGFTEYHLETLTPYYNDGLEFLRDAGVPEDVVTSDAAIGCLARYVLDTYNLTANEVKLSSFFFQRLKQLQAKGVATDAEVTES